MRFSASSFSIPIGPFQIFRKLAEIFAHECLLAVSARENFGGINIFHMLGAYLSALDTLSTNDTGDNQNPFFTSVNDTGVKHSFVRPGDIDS